MVSLAAYGSKVTRQILSYKDGPGRAKKVNYEGFQDDHCDALDLVTGYKTGNKARWV